MLKVQARQCESCIYLPRNRDMIPELERQIADRYMAGYFSGFRACHHAAKDVCCRGFWNRHKDHFTAGQLAQRLNLVQFVDVDKLARRRRSRKLESG